MAEGYVGFNWLERGQADNNPGRKKHPSFHQILLIPSSTLTSLFIFSFFLL